MLASLALRRAWPVERPLPRVASEQTTPSVLFGMTELGLATPDCYPAAAARRIGECRRLVDGLVSGRAEPRRVLRTIDEVSRLLCEVIDSAEVCRTTHTDAAWRAAAGEAWTAIARYMNEINAYRPLYQALDGALADGERGGQLDAVDVHMCHLQLHDFRSGGIHLPDDQRHAVVQLQAHIADLSHQFFAHAHHSNTDPQPHHNAAPSFNDSGDDGDADEFILTDQQVRQLRTYQLPPPLATNTRSGERVYALTAALADLLVSCSPDADVRRRALLQAERRHASNVAVLHELLAARHQLGRALGAQSFADHMMATRILNSPGAAIDFLGDVAAHVRPQVHADLALLADCKLAEEAPGAKRSHIVVEEWDRRYYKRRLRSRHDADVQVTLERCLRVLHSLVACLWGVQLHVVQLAPNEHCSPATVKVRVSDTADDGRPRHIGDVYMDIFSRPGKIDSPASYVQQFPRQLDDGSWSPARVTLVCNFPEQRQQCLDLSMAETLWHEWGHVLHVLFSRTRYQHVAGTRVPLDFVETPSTLMEHFFWHPAVLRQLDPAANVDAVLDSRALFFGLDTQHQIFLSMLDLRMHSADPARSDPMATYRRVYDECGVTPYHPGMNPGSFSHLHGYAAGYYGYLLCRAISSNLWNAHFRQDPFNQPAAAAIRQHIHQQGGSKNPAELLANLLDRPFDTSSFAQKRLT